MMPSDAPKVPARKIPLAEMRGPHTGTVAGKGEIDCVEYGRMLVHLHWDLDRAYTIRCRVSQSWASKGWGGRVIPRIGMKVMVEFPEGDPDKPLVTGCVHNGKNEAPYPLPENKTKSVFRSETHQGDRWQAGSGKTSVVPDAASGKITTKADDFEIKGRNSIRMTAPRIDLNCRARADGVLSTRRGHAPRYPGGALFGHRPAPRHGVTLSTRHRACVAGRTGRQRPGDQPGRLHGAERRHNRYRRAWCGNNGLRRAFRL
jgi:hypothetical protein